MSESLPLSLEMDAMGAVLSHPLIKAPSVHSHVDPLLKRVSQVVLADGVRQGPQGWLELHYGPWQVLEPAAQLHLLIQNFAFSWKNCAGRGWIRPMWTTRSL